MQKKRWSILVPRTTSPIFNQFTSGILHSVLHLVIYNIKQAYELVCHLGNSAGKNCFLSFFLIGNGQTYFKFFNIHLKTFILRNLLDEAVSVEIIN